MTETPKTPDQIKDERRRQIALQREKRTNEFSELVREDLERDGVDMASLNGTFFWDYGPKITFHNEGHRDIIAIEWGDDVLFCIGGIWGDSHSHYGDALIAAEIKPSWLARLFGKGGAK